MLEQSIHDFFDRWETFRDILVAGLTVWGMLGLALALFVMCRAPRVREGQSDRSETSPETTTAGTRGDDVQHDNTHV